MKNYKSHNAYFEQIASQLKDIEHSEENKRFATIDTKEVLSGVRNKIKGSVFFLDKYFVTWEGSHDNRKKVLNGAFNIVRKVENGNFSEQDEAHNWAEQLSEQVIAQMLQDAKQLTTLWKLDLSGDMMPLSNMPMGYYGMRQEYQIKIDVGLCKDDSLWVGGATPPDPNEFRLIIIDQNNNELSNTIEQLQAEITKQINIAAPEPVNYLVRYENGDVIEQGTAEAGENVEVVVDDVIPKNYILRTNAFEGESSIFLTIKENATLNTITTDLTITAIELNGSAVNLPGLNVVLNNTLEIFFNEALADEAIEIGGVYE